MSTELKARIQADLNRARKARDRARTLVLGTTLSEIRNLEIDRGTAATDEDVIGVLTRAVKQRREVAQTAADAGRPEFAEKEEAEAEILITYLPEQLTEGEVRGMVREILAGGASDMGAVMGRLMPRLEGRFEGREANRIVREELEV